MSWMFGKNIETFESVEQVLEALEYSTIHDDLIPNLCTPQSLSKIVSYVVADTHVLCNFTHEEKLRYPQLACTLLTMKIPKIEELLVSNQYLCVLYNYFSRPREDQGVANVVLTVLEYLMSNRYAESLAYLQTSPKSLLNLICNPNTITPLYLNTLLKNDEENSYTVQNLLLDINLPNTLLNCFHRTYSDFHISHCLEEMIGVVLSDSPLMKVLGSREWCEQLIGMMRKGSTLVFQQGASVFVAHLKALEKLVEVTASEGIRQPIPYPLIALPPCVQVLVEEFPSFCEMLGVEDSIKFGYRRLSILQILKKLLQLNYSEVNAVVADSPILEIIFNLIIRFPKNNIAHQAVVGLFEVFFSVANTELHRKVLQNTNITQNLVSNIVAITQAQPPYRCSYISYLYSVLITIEKTVQGDPFLKSYLEGVVGYQHSLKLAQERLFPDIT